jgi:hypothetical protein
MGAAIAAGMNARMISWRKMRLMISPLTLDDGRPLTSKESEQREEHKGRNIMAKLLAPAGIVLAIGFGSVAAATLPPEQVVEEVIYQDAYNYFELHVSASDIVESTGIITIGGKAGAPTQGTIYLCEGSTSGSAISDILNLSTDTSTPPRVVLTFFSDYPKSLGTCHGTATDKTLGEINETSCQPIAITGLGLRKCDVSHFFGLPAGYVIIESAETQ